MSSSCPGAIYPSFLDFLIQDSLCLVTKGKLIKYFSTITVSLRYFFNDLLDSSIIGQGFTWIFLSFCRSEIIQPNNTDGGTYLVRLPLTTGMLNPASHSL